MEIEQSNKVDENLYSRQIGTFGMETMTKLVRMKVLILGMGGLGVETAKNLILAGPNSVTIWDPKPCSEEDMGANCYIDESHVKSKTTRSAACLPFLSQLNPYVTLNIDNSPDLTKFSSFESLKNIDIVVVTDVYDYETLKNINVLCKQGNKGFIMAACKGLLGFTFVDFGNEHVVFDKNGEQCKSVLISSITRDGVVTTQEDKRHDLEDGDLVKFKEVVGMESLNEKTIKVEKVLTPFTFQLEDISGVLKEGEEYVRNGIVEEVKAKIKPVFRNLEESLEHFDTKEFDLEPDMDFMKPWRLIQLKFVFSKILKDQAKYLPPGFDVSARNVDANVEELRKLLEPEVVEEESIEATAENSKIEEEKVEEKVEESDSKIVEEAQNPPEEESNKIEEETPNETESNKIEEEKPEEEQDPEWIKKLDTNLVKYCLAYWNLELSPMTCFWGGIVAQEIVKFTGKFSPINQWMIHEFYSTLFKHLEPENVLKSLECEASGRYRDQILLLGPDIQNMIQKTNLFMIGAGALGCEYLKLFALMGMGASEKGLVSVTDDDTIEISNLNRQFLFRKKHVGKSKSETATVEAVKMNPGLNVKAYTQRVEPNNENIFTDTFWDNLTFIVNAVDNIKARMYVDGKAVLHKKWLFEAGTLGTKCNSQIVIPMKTESYSDSTDPEEKHIPMCTLRNFPFLIEHCIEWSREKFFSRFQTASKELKKIQSNREEYFKTLNKEAKADGASVVEKLQGVNALVELAQAPTDENMLKFARNEFIQHFDKEISKLLRLFPKDFKDKEGNVFWRSPKRAPTASKFDKNNENHVKFVQSILNILSQIFVGSKVGKMTLEEVKKGLNQIGDALVEEEKIVDEEEERKKALNKNNNNQDDDLSDNIENLQKMVQIVNPKLVVNEIEFEKDDDSNGHIDFMTLCSNFRAGNYEIEQAPRHKIKMIAGKIIPAIATTTAMVIGAMGIEFYKFFLQSPLENMRNFFSNLGISMINFSEPMPPVISKDKDYDPIVLGPIKAMPPKWNTWTRIEVKGKNMKIGELRDHLNSTMNIEMEGLTAGRLLVWNSFGQQPDYSDKTIEEVYKDCLEQYYPEKKYFVFNASAVDKDMIDLNLPAVVYIREED
jgi:ubiquitin-activating enzyme E1